MTLAPPAKKNILGELLPTFTPEIIAKVVLLGGDPKVAESDINEVIKLVNSLSSLANEWKQNRKRVTEISEGSVSECERMSIRTLTNMHKDVDWIRLISTFVINSNSSEVITEDEIMCFDKPILKKLMALLKSAKPRTVANMVALEVFGKGIQAIIPIEKIPAEFNKYLTSRCFLDGEIFDKALASIYVKKHLNEMKHTRSKAKLLVNMFLKEMKVLISSVKWMDDITKKKAMQKVDHMGSKVGYEDELLDINRMNAFMSCFYKKWSLTVLLTIRYV